MAAEPIVLRWVGGEVGLGYLGELRWRVVTPEGTVEVEDTRAATTAALERIFRGVAPGRESAERAPLRLELPGAAVGSRRIRGW